MKVGTKEHRRSNRGVRWKYMGSRRGVGWAERGSRRKVLVLADEYKQKWNRSRVEVE